MSIEKVTQERLDIAQQLKNELEEMRDIQEESGDFLSKQLGLYKDVNVINKELLAKESLKRNVSNDFAKQQLKQIQGQNIIRKNVSAQLAGFKINEAKNLFCNGKILLKIVICFRSVSNRRTFVVRNIS